MHIAEKYSSLARDAMSSGDSVAAENYLQHAEHYNRIILAAQAQNPGIQGDQSNGMNGNGSFNHGEPFSRDYDNDSEDGEGDDFPPHRNFHEPQQRNYREPQQRNHQEPRNFQEPQQRSFQERPVYNHNQPQPSIPQNAFPHVQPHSPPVAPAQNGTVPHSSEKFVSAQEEPVARRRRRRPLGEHAGANGFNGRGAQPHAPGVNTGDAAGDPVPDETKS